jgi:hypothetical protein
MWTHHEYSVGRPVPAELNHVRLVPVHAGDHVEGLGCGPGPQDDAVAECSPSILARISLISVSRSGRG